MNSCSNPPCPGIDSPRPKLLTSISLRRTAALVLALVLCGCGGGGGNDPASGSEPPPPSMSGTVSAGVVIEANNFEGLDVTVKGSAGTARETSAVAVTTRYGVTLDQLAGPYLLSASVLDGIRLLAPASAAGTANLTPLTTLLVAWVVGEDPSAYFDNTLDGQGGVPAFTDADVAAAQAEVTRYLTRVTRVVVDAGIASRSWVSEPMENAPGDPMFEQIVRLNQALVAADSSLAQLADEIAAQKQRCDRASVAVSGSIGPSRFCQKGSSASFSNGNSVQTFDFTDIEGSTLTLRLTHGVVDMLRYVTREGSFGCDGASACLGVTVGALAADDTVPVVLSAVKLRSAAGAEVLLSGTLSGAGALPTLPCDLDKLYLLDPAGGVRGLCLFEANTSFRGAQEDYNWGSQDGEFPYYVELVSSGTSGTDVASIDVWWYDPDTGNPVTLYRCEGGGCSGVTIGEPYDTVDDYGDPLRARDFTLRNVPLLAVDGAGQLGSGVAMRISASLTNRVPRVSFRPDCSTSVEHNRVTFSDTTPAIDVCPPPPSSDDYYSFKGASSYYLPDDPDAVDFSVSTYVFPEDGSRSALNTLHVIVSGNTLRKVVLQTYGDSRSFSCSAAACAGVTVSLPDDQGQRTIGFNGAALAEDPVRQIPGSGAMAQVNGGFLTLSDPYFVPLSNPARVSAAAPVRADTASRR